MIERQSCFVHFVFIFGYYFGLHCKICLICFGQRSRKFALFKSFGVSQGLRPVHHDYHFDRIICMSLMYNISQLFVLSVYTC